MRLILASTSPRRKELLSLLGVRFEVAEPAFVERMAPNSDPSQQAKMFAEQKARSCAEGSPEALILGSDTLISLGNRLLGKPADLGEAEAMLNDLRGREHLVHTAVAIYQKNSGALDVTTDIAKVWMRAFTQAEVDDYLGSAESLGKAGAYSIQGRGGELVSRIEGDFSTIVGLPLRLVAQMLECRGMIIPISVDDLYRIRPYPNWERFSQPPLTPSGYAGG